MKVIIPLHQERHNKVYGKTRLKKKEKNPETAILHRSKWLNKSSAEILLFHTEIYTVHCFELKI